MKVIKGDTVVVISGTSKSVSGDKAATHKVLQAFPAENKVIVEGVNMVTRHTKPKKLGEAGKYICTVRKVGYKLTDSEEELEQ